MIFLMVAWSGLILTCWLIALAILNEVKADGFERIGDSEALLHLRQHGALAKRHEVQQQSADRFIIAVWLGVVILAVSLLAISIVLPLSLFVGAGVTFTMAAIALRLQRTRAEIRTLLSSLSAKPFLPLLNFVTQKGE